MTDSANQTSLHETPYCNLQQGPTLDASTSFISRTPQQPSQQLDTTLPSGVSRYSANSITQTTNTAEPQPRREVSGTSWGVSDPVARVAVARSNTGSSALQQSRLGERKESRERTLTKKVNEYFVEKVEAVGSSLKLTFTCKQCQFAITAQKPRERLFHLIVCRDIPLTTRMGFHTSTEDKQKPPLIPLPRRGITASEARREANKEYDDLARSLNLRQLADDPSKDPNFYRYITQTQEQKRMRSSTIDQCSEEETKAATKLLLEFLIEENVAFAVCDKRSSFPRPLRKLLAYLRPGFPAPLGYLFRGTLLDQYYETMKKDMRTRLSDLLLDGRATLMFDGSEDINGAPMVNTLLRVMGLDHLSTTTFFLTTIYTGYDTVDSAYYAEMAERVVQQFFGFHKVAEIVTDNTGSVKNARESLEKKHPRVVASQDQAQVADRLIHDMEGIKWIKTVLELLTGISSALRRFRKMRALFIELMNKYNRSLSSSENEMAVDAQNMESGTIDNRTESYEVSNASDPNSESVLYARDTELSRVRLVEPGTEVSAVARDSDEASESDTGSDSDEEEPSPSMEASVNGSSRSTISRRTAVTLKKVSAVRFASHEKIMEEFIRTRPVLLQLISDPLFEKVYATRNKEEKQKRKKCFTDPIRNEDFFCKVKQIHAIFRALRSYLRVFDCESSIASEIFEATSILEAMLINLPLNSFPEPSVAKRKEILDVFENRKRGPLPGRKKIKISLLSDLHIAAALLDPYRTPRGVSEYMERFRRHPKRYMSGVDLGKIGISESDRGKFYDEMTVVSLPCIHV